MSCKDCEALLKRAEAADNSAKLILESRSELLKELEAAEKALAEREHLFMAAAADVHAANKHPGSFDDCPKHRCVHLRESINPRCAPETATLEHIHSRAGDSLNCSGCAELIVHHVTCPDHRIKLQCPGI